MAARLAKLIHRHTNVFDRSTREPPHTRMSFILRSRALWRFLSLPRSHLSRRLLLPGKEGGAPRAPLSNRPSSRRRSRGPKVPARPPQPFPPKKKHSVRKKTGLGNFSVTINSRLALTHIQSWHIFGLLPEEKKLKMASSSPSSARV